MSDNPLVDEVLAADRPDTDDEAPVVRATDDPQYDEAEQQEAESSRRWYNVNEDGEAYGEHDSQSDAEAVQRKFPSDTVVEASSREEAERLAWLQPEEELTVQQIVELNPTMSAMAVELRDASESWLHTSVDPDSEVDFEKAALIAYQAMVKYPPRTQNQLMLWVLTVLPEATFGEDIDGQLLIYTNLTEVDENGDRTNPRLTDMGESPQ